MLTVYQNFANVKHHQPAAGGGGGALHSQPPPPALLNQRSCRSLPQNKPKANGRRRGPCSPDPLLAALLCPESPRVQCKTPPPTPHKRLWREGNQGLLSSGSCPWSLQSRQIHKRQPTPPAHSLSLAATIQFSSLSSRCHTGFGVGPPTPLRGQSLKCVRRGCGHSPGTASKLRPPEGGESSQWERPVWGA